MLFLRCGDDLDIGITGGRRDAGSFPDWKEQVDVFSFRSVSCPVHWPVVALRGGAGRGAHAARLHGNVADERDALTAHLSRWLSSEGIDLGEVSGGVIERFLTVRRATYANHYSMQALRPILAHLRREGLVPAEQPAPTPSSSVELLLVRFRQYLVVDRGVAGPDADAYSHWVTPFAHDVAGREYAAIGDLAVGDVARFLTTRLPAMTRKTAQMTARHGPSSASCIMRAWSTPPSPTPSPRSRTAAYRGCLSR